MRPTSGHDVKDFAAGETVVVGHGQYAGEWEVEKKLPKNLMLAQKVTGTVTGTVTRRLKATPLYVWKIGEDIPEQAEELPQMYGAGQFVRVNSRKMKGIYMVLRDSGRTLSVVEPGGNAVFGRYYNGLSKTFVQPLAKDVAIKELAEGL